MHKLYLNLIACCILLCSANWAMAQKPLVSATKKAELDQLAIQLQDTYALNQQKALSLASLHNWITNKTDKDGNKISLQRLTTLGFPLFYKTYNNVIAAATTRTNDVQPGGSLGVNLSGSSTFLNNKLAIWDGGAVFGGHQEFAGKTITLKNAALTDLHATHVAGTMIAKGIYAPAKGMAFNAATLQSYDFNNDVAEITSAASGLLLSNHSYGVLAGWDYDADNSRWVWYGLPGDSVDYKFGFYDSESRSLDQVAVNAPYYLVVVAAGNSRGYPGPAIGETYYGYTSRTNTTIINKGPRPAGISNNTGYDIIPGFANAKNVLTVGAVNQLPFGPTSKQDISISYFSAIGPTDDGRVKPDVCGDGDAVLSTSNSSPTAYAVLSGTSMSTPNVTGSLYLLQEYYAKQNAGNFMRSATLKALVCHTAFDAGNTGPDYIFGWGLLDTRAAAQVITSKGSKSLMNENTLAQGQTQTINVIASGNGTLAATLAWTDPQATLSADGTINDRTAKLVNDLDIRISDCATTFSPWVLNPLTPGVAAGRSDNSRDNVEQVYLNNAIPGRAYTITITHKGTLQGGSQPYSLIVTGVGGAAYCASAPSSNADSRINNFSLSNISNTPPAGCTAYSNYTNLTAQLEQGKSYPLSLTLGTCGANFNKAAKVYIDWNGDGTFNNTDELVATTPAPINTTGTFTTNISVPAIVVPGNYSLLRIVMAEANTPDAITPCGTYAKGETQDYRVQFVLSTRDVGVLSVSNTTVGGGCSGVNNISVRLKNFGSAAVGNIPVTVTVTPSNGGAVSTFTETYTNTLSPSAEEDFILNGNFTAVAGVSYVLTATTGLSGDVNAANNQATQTVTIGTAPVPTNLAATYCNDSDQYLLSGSGDGQLFWYTSATGGMPIGTGQFTFTKTVPPNNTYYAGLNDFAGNVGPATKNVFSNGGYNQFGQAVFVITKAPVIIQSARLYVGNAGRITVTATNANGEQVARTTLNVTATRTTPAAGAQNDDPADQGRVYNLNLQLPAAGSYTLSISYANGATLYRSNSGVSGYPFHLGDIFSITGNNATSATNPSDTTAYRNFYYYFYDMRVVSSGCSSASRVPVQINNPVIFQNGSTLVSNFSHSNQWYLNGQPIAGATGITFIPQQSGNYQLRNTLVTGCTAISPVYTFIKTDGVTNASSAIKLVAFPVPVQASALLNVALVAPTNGNLGISLISTDGRIAYRGTTTVMAGNFATQINVNGQPPGTYVLRVLLGGKAYSTKVIITP